MEHPANTAETNVEELVRRVAEGDQGALSALYDHLAGSLLAVAMRVLHDTATAEDVLQDVFVQIWERAASFDRNRGTAFGWAVVITRNRALDRVRARGRANQMLERAAPELLEQTSSASMPRDTEQNEHLRTAIDGLTDEQRIAIEMAFFGGLSQTEISEKLRKPLGTIKANIRRGMLKLRDRLQPSGKP